MQEINREIRKMIKNGTIKSDGIRQLSTKFGITKAKACSLWLSTKEKMYAKGQIEPVKRPYYRSGIVERTRILREDIHITITANKYKDRKEILELLVKKYNLTLKSAAQHYNNWRRSK